jgi:hypothetical protein
MSLPTTWKEWGEALAAFLPGPISMVLVQWQALFANTLFAHRQWQYEATDYVVGPSVIVAIVLILYFFDKTKAVRRRAVWVAAGVSVLGLLSCVALNYILRLPRTEPAIEAVIQVWAVVYFLSLLAIAAFVSLFALLLVRH